MGIRKLAARRFDQEQRQHFEIGDADGDLEASEDTPELSAGVIANVPLPRVLYIDVDDDLAMLLDRVEEAGSPAIIVLPEGARAVHGVVSARVLSRRAESAGITLVAVATDRVAITQLTAVGVNCVSTVGEARATLAAALAPTDTPSMVVVGTARAMPTIMPKAFPVPAQIEVQPSDTSDIFSDLADVDFADEPESDVVDVAPATARVSTVDHADRPGIAHAPTRNRWLLAVGALATMIMLGVATWIVFFPRATLTIHYQFKTYSQIFDVPVGTGTTGSIPLHSTHLQMSASSVVAGTGTMTVPDRHAGGTVTFANPLDGVVIIPAGTVLHTLGGMKFVTTAEARVPGAVHNFSGTSNGQQSVAVEAIEAGTASNVDPGAITGIEGRLAGAVLVTNYNALTGGTMRTVYSITPSDLAAPITPLRQSIAARENALLATRYAKSPLRLFGAPTLVSSAVQRFVQGGRPYARVTVTVRTNMNYIHEQDVQAFAIAKRTAALADKNERIVGGTSSVAVHTIGSGPRTHVQVQVQARTAPSIDTANLRALLTGRSVADARQLLDGSARNGDWHYVLHVSPDWAARLPVASSLISIVVERGQ